MLAACGNATPADDGNASQAALNDATDVPVLSLPEAPCSRPIRCRGQAGSRPAAARAHFASHPDDPDALIWIARRLGYLWRYREAIAVLDEGIERWPDNPRLYRHRGHRHITVRDFARAQADLERAAELIAGQPDEIEPDGAPNPAGIPRTTLAYNIWYHLGLARFLQGDYAGALAAYEETMRVSDNDDAIVAATDWTWMTLMRLGREDEAAALLGRISPDMDLLENDGYHRRLLMYKGLESAEALLNPATADSTDIATQGYGVANFHLVHGETARAGPSSNESWQARAGTHSATSPRRRTCSASNEADGPFPSS